MKISLLLRREPFVAILQRTLTDYWSRTSGHPTSITWKECPWPRWGRGTAPGEWLCHPRLNAIFSERIDPRALTPIRGEFSRSLRPLLRPWQRLFVSTALDPRISPWLASARLRSDPPIPEADEQLIIPGNQKIRLLHRRAGTTTSILKEGFSRQVLSGELTRRAIAIDYGIPAPRVCAASPDEGWFREQYVDGVPLNRLASPADREQRMDEALRCLAPLILGTRQTVAAEGYLDQLLARISDHWRTWRPEEAPLREKLSRVAERIATDLRARISGGVSLDLALTHGDFQPANLLLDSNTLWIIDWEHAGTRQANYDVWVLLAGSRFPRGMIARMARLQSAGDPRLTEWPRSGPATKRHTHVTSSEVGSSALIFLLEELEWRLAEAANPLFYGLPEGLRELADELISWERLCAPVK